MLRNLKAFLCVLVLALPFPALAGPQVSIEQLAPLAGRWAGTGINGAEAGEAYSDAVGGQMVGYFYQLTEDGDVMFYETLTIVPDGDGSLVLRLKHFNADLAGWETRDAQSAVEFPLTSFTETRWEFGGLVYEFLSNDELRISVLAEVDPDNPQWLTFYMTRQQP